MHFLLLFFMLLCCLRVAGSDSVLLSPVKVGPVPVEVDSRDHDVVSSLCFACHDPSDSLPCVNEQESSKTIQTTIGELTLVGLHVDAHGVTSYDVYLRPGEAASNHVNGLKDGNELTKVDPHTLPRQVRQELAAVAHRTLYEKSSLLATDHIARDDGRSFMSNEEMKSLIPDPFFGHESNATNDRLELDTSRPARPSQMYLRSPANSTISAAAADANGFTQVTTTTVFSKNHNVKIFSDGSLVCSGTLISNIHVLTAAHCLYNLWTKKFYSELNIVVCPAQTRDKFSKYTSADGCNSNTMGRYPQAINHCLDAPYGCSRAAQLRISSQFSQITCSSSSECSNCAEDWGIIDLKVPIGARLGYHGDTYLDSSSATTFSYPSGGGYSGAYQVQQLKISLSCQLLNSDPFS